MITRTPRVSILMPVYNVEHFIDGAISSILNQTFTDFEFIIINDGSTDNTDIIVASFNDPRIVYVKQETNRKKIACLNDGLKIAHGEYIVFMDGDDIVDKDWLEELYSFLDKHSFIGVCGTWFQSFGESSMTYKFPLTNDEIYFGLFTGCPVTHPMVRKEILLANLIDFDPDFFSEDSYLLIRLADITEAANIPKVLYHYRVHSSQVTQLFQNILNDSVKREKNIHFNNLYKKISGRVNDTNIEFQPTSFTTSLTLNKYQNLVLEIINLNTTKKLFTEEYLNVTLSTQFYNQLNYQFRYNLFTLFLFYRSPLIRYISIGKRNHLKLIIKSLLFKRTRFSFL